MKKLIARVSTKCPLTRRVEVQTATSRAVSWVPDGHRAGDVEVLIDVDRLVALYGPDALKNKGGRARGMNGCVEIMAVRGSVKDHRLEQKQPVKVAS